MMIEKLYKYQTMHHGILAPTLFLLVSLLQWSNLFLITYIAKML